MTDRKTLTVPTTLHCQGCVDKLSKILDDEPSINSWSVNLDSDIKSLTITGEKLNERIVDKFLRQAGYEIIKEHSFWSDINAWKRASFNTLNCLIGCSIGDFGMVFYLQAYHPETSLTVQMILAIIAGLITSICLETVLLKSREEFSWSLALKTAFGMSFISMVAMELAMTSTDFMITGGKAAFDDVWYWLALIPALIAGFITPLPYNYYKLKKFNQACH